jgi:DNA-binding GntR family transcriptional regulator
MRSRLPHPRFTAPAQAETRLIAVPTLVEKAHEHLLSMLVSMEIAPDARIPIDTLARQLGISQTPIREALSRLEAEGLVVKMPNVGYRASSQMTADEVDDLFVLRLLIEPYAAARAAEAMDDAQLKTVGEIGEQMAQIQRSGSAVEYAHFADADASLHRIVALGSGNHLIAETIARLHIHLHIFRFLYNTDAPEEAAREHTRLISALIARDSKGAEAAMRRHLEHSRRRMERAQSAAQVTAES